MDKKIDLHTHSNASDGLYSPETLIDMAIKEGLSVIAITDHDTLGGLPPALAYAETKDITMVPGVEFSVDSAKGAMHIIGLYIDHDNNDINTVLFELRDFRENRALRIIEDLRKHGIDIPFDEVISEANGGSVGKPHVARVLIKHGYGKTIEDIFKQFMSNGKPGDIEKKKIAPQLAVDLITGAGGISVLAHPVSLEYTKEEMEKLVINLKEMGMSGLEAYSPMHSNEEVQFYIELCKKYDLMVSGGSDFHGDRSIRLGHYSENDFIPYSVYEELKKYTSLNNKIN